MIRIGILGKIGSGKSYIADNFGFPVFNADKEVAKIYKKDKNIFIKLNKILPKYIYSFPISKNEITNAILANKNNLKKIVTIVHKEIRKKMKLFLNKNKNKKAIVFDIPLLLENKLYEKNDILIFIDSSKIDIEKKLKKRPGYNKKLINKFKKLQLSSQYKKKRSHFIIKNNFTKKSIKVAVKNILNKIF